MEFRKWLEWEGFTFPGDDSQYYNTDGFPRSKYKGPTNPLARPEGEIPFSKIEKMYGFKKKPGWLKKKSKKKRRRHK